MNAGTPVAASDHKAQPLGCASVTQDTLMI